MCALVGADAGDGDASVSRLQTTVGRASALLERLPRADLPEKPSEYNHLIFSMRNQLLYEKLMLRIEEFIVH
jgi:hypothetical protein